MNHCFESPKNCKKTNPIEYNYNENIKERHYFGKYNPNNDSMRYKNSKLPEIETFNFSNNCNNVNKNDNIDSHDNNNARNKLKYAIKSIII